MTILDRLLGFFGIRRILLHKPLTLLGQYYYDVLDRIYASPYGIEEDIDWGLMYYSYDEEDPAVQVCVWETRKILHTVKHDKDDRVVAAGKVYIDKDKDFLESLVSRAVSGKRRVYGKVDYCHYGLYDESEEEYYVYNDDVYIMVYRESGAYEQGHSVTIEYVQRDTSATGHKENRGISSARRCVADDRRRILADLEKTF